jgi:HupE / UreJ protein
VIRRALLILVLALAGRTAQAHVASNGFLELNVAGRDVTGSVELAVRDVELAVGVDADGDGRITWGELRGAEPRLRAYLLSRFTLSAQGASCEVRFGAMRVNPRVDGNYAWLPLSAHCLQPVHAVEIRYRILDDVDSSHRGLLRLTAGTALQAAVLGGSHATMTLAIDRPAPWHTFIAYFQAGTTHIFGGIDHLLFLLSLLLPAVLRRRDHRWEPVECGRPAFWSILKVVTAFTLAHSITLSLAAFDLVHLPSRLTESVIAASIMVAALNNIVPVVTESRARIAFAFGLLHGFGFASVLAEMGLPVGARLACLVAFNLGIEAGQLAVVVAVMPLAYALRRLSAYRHAILPWGSAVIAGLALVWFIERAFLPA